MSLSPDMVFQIIEVIQKAVEIYHRIQDVPETIHKLGRRMKWLETILSNLEHHMRSKAKHALARLRKTQVDDLLSIVGDTRADCDRVYVLFDRWARKVGPLGLQFRDNALGQFVAQAFFALGSSAKELEALTEDIETHRRDIDTYLGLMGVQFAQANHFVLQDMNKKIDTMQEVMSQVMQGVAQSTPQLSSAPIQTAKPNNTKGQSSNENQLQKPRATKPRFSPSPSPPRRDIKIIFVDPHNLGRSICSEALTKLYGQLTASTGGVWRIPIIHSAGFFVKHRGNVAELLPGLAYRHQSYQLALSDGGRPPNRVATAAVFDNPSFGRVGLFKDALRDEIAARAARGLRRDVFDAYDYIIVFTGREHDNMLKLRAAIAASGPASADRHRSRARIVHLGRYVQWDGVVREILDPPKNKDGKHQRWRWNQKVAELKIAIRRFLQMEMDWVPPEPATAKQGK